jgi:uncharacterized protein YodC (DUF2158 family)
MFQVNDIVTLKSSSGKQKVTKVSASGDYISTKYCKSSYGNKCRRASDFEHFNPAPEKEEIMTTITKIFKVLGTEKYGTYLTGDSHGRIVLEIRGSDEVRAFPKSEIEEVVPYTIQVSNSRHYSTAIDVVKVGDWLLLGDSFEKVTGVNTGCKNAPDLPKSTARVVTEALDAPAA